MQDEAPTPHAVRFDGLDVVRTLLAMLVATGHFFLWNQITNVIPSTFFMAVDFFFVLSGFVLTQSVLVDPNSSFKDFIARFALRRIFRLYPLYLLMFIVTIGLLVWRYGAAWGTLHQFLITLTLLHAMGPDTTAEHIFADTPIGIGWSISVELWASLIFFSAIYYLRSRPKYLILFCLLVAGGGLALVFFFSPNVMNVNLQRLAHIATFGEIRGFLGFAFGCLGYLLYCRARTSIKNQPWLFTLAEVILIVIVCVLYLHRGIYNRNYEFLAPLLAMIAIILVSLKQGWLSRSLYSPRLAAMRPLSYSIYLVHPLFVFLFRYEHWAFTSAHAIPYLIGVIAAAALLYRSVERPGIQVGRNVLQRGLR